MARRAVVRRPRCRSSCWTRRSAGAWAKTPTSSAPSPGGSRPLASRSGLQGAGRCGGEGSGLHCFPTSRFVHHRDLSAFLGDLPRVACDDGCGLCLLCRSERAEEVGLMVGYQIRLEKRAADSTRLLFCTTGILLRRLQLNPTLQGTSPRPLHHRESMSALSPLPPLNPPLPPLGLLPLLRCQPRDIGRGARALDRVGLPAHHSPGPAGHATGPPGHPHVRHHELGTYAYDD